MLRAERHHTGRPHGFTPFSTHWAKVRMIDMEMIMVSMVREA